jgi:curved DNA-binding protein CbpA
MKDYYKILGVRSTASDADIKRAFRQLAVRYHPDKNSDPAAELLFKEINEAYTVLSDPQKRAGYDWKRQRPLSDLVQEPAKPQHRDPAYRKPRPTQPTGKSERQRMFEMMRQYQSTINRISMICFSISMMMLIDYSLPNRVSEERIVNTYPSTNHATRYSTTLHVIVTDWAHQIELPVELSDYFRVDDNVLINSSLLFAVARRVEANGKIIPIRKSIYGNFIFAPGALLLISFLALVFRNNVEKSFNYGLVSIVILFFTGVIILLL